MIKRLLFIIIDWKSLFCFMDFLCVSCFVQNLDWKILSGCLVTWKIYPESFSHECTLLTTYILKLQGCWLLIHQYNKIILHFNTSLVFLIHFPKKTEIFINFMNWQIHPPHIFSYTFFFFNQSNSIFWASVCII